MTICPMSDLSADASAQAQPKAASAIELTVSAGSAQKKLDKGLKPCAKASPAYSNVHHTLRDPARNDFRILQAW
jgi:hypothetical protein